MSFQDKISAIMARPGQDPVAKDDVPWWLKIGGRSLGTVAGFFAIFFGVFNWFGIITGQIAAILAGVWLIIAGFLLLCIEAPCCCMFIDHVQRFSDKVDGRPYWNRAIFYFFLAIPPIFIDYSISLLFACALIFCTGMLYGMMALGRKATAEEMRQAAAVEAQAPAPGPAAPSSGMRSNLVDNAQPFSFTGPPAFDGNV